jgi:hypothetical protein
VIRAIAAIVGPRAFRDALELLLLWNGDQKHAGALGGMNAKLARPRLANQKTVALEQAAGARAWFC